MAGPFFFAWLTAPEPFNPDYHATEDEHVLRFQISHNEGDYPTCSIDIENPRVGLLSRPFWMWLSWDKNWVPDESHTPEFHPLFLGRLIGIPNMLNKEIITLEFVARPKDHAEQRTAIADSLRVLPYYDPVFISADKWNDADTVLEGYSKLWHIDRVSHVITVSDLVVGEDGLQEFTEAEIPYDSVQMQLGQAPFATVTVEATCKWTQAWRGAAVNIVSGTIKTLTGGSIKSAWPENDNDIGEGYIAANSYCSDLWDVENLDTMSFSISWNSPNEKHEAGDTISSSMSATRPRNWGIPGRYELWPLTTHTEAGIGKSSVQTTDLHLEYWLLNYNLDVKYAIDRGRTEIARFTMRANIQPILSDPDEVEAHEIQVTANDVDKPIPFEGEIGGLPIGDVGRGSYFETGRGQQSLQFLMSLARAALINAARCVELSASIPFERAIELSCRMNGRIHDPRIPGGQALGKIKEYSINADGQSGAMIGSVTIACCIGYGDALIENAGVPTYGEEDWDISYQQREGQTVVLSSGDVVYTKPLFAGQDDGARFPLTKKQIVLEEKWHLGAQAIPPGIKSESGFGSSLTETDIKTAQEKADQAIQVMTENPTWLELKLKNLNGSFTSPYEVTTATLELPKQIDLEFGAS